MRTLARRSATTFSADWTVHNFGGKIKFTMEKTEDGNTERYIDGTIALEIERLLVSRLHNLNTIEEIETLKLHFHQEMMAVYSIGQERIVNQCI